jgi:hypothetical protein
MKKFFIGSVIMAALFLFTNCAGPDGGAYLKYTWTFYKPSYFSDSNPSTPSTVTNDEYFPTRPGTYHMEYTMDYESWYLDYTLSAKKGSSFNTAGDDTYFEIGLYSFGPSLYNWGPYRSVRDEGKKTAESGPVVVSRGKLSEGKQLGEIIGTEEKETPNGTIKIEYGKILPIAD